MKDLRRRFEVFCFQNRNKGIPNLMLYICIGNAIVYVMSSIAKNLSLYSLLTFSRELILQGQVWRLLSYPLTMYNSNLFLMFIYLLCYYSLGTAIERQWGTLRFNLFYLSGMLLMDLFAMLIGGSPDVYYLNMSLFISYATLYPDAQFLLFFVIPVKAWAFAVFDLVVIFLGVIGGSFPGNLMPIVALGNYLLFFGSDVINILPVTLRAKAAKALHKNTAGPKIIHFRTSGGSSSAPRETTRPGYTHRCTVCGRTDLTDPGLEFRYCSRCKGYYCYCEEHINSHAHIQ